MATYTPKNLIGPAASITSTVTAYVSPAATNGIARTIMACANEAAHSLTVSLGADGVGTRIIAAYALSANVPALWNGWWVTAQNSAHAIDMSSDTATANKVVGTVNGYEYA